MLEPDFARLARARVGVLGLGLMGGSLALALRGHVAAVHGIDVDEATRTAASPHFDRVSGDLSDFRGEALILATPIRATLELIPGLSRALQPGTVVLDLCSTKSRVVAALGSLPATLQPIGGHPICGKETSGFASADPELYRGAPFVLSPLPRTTPESLAFASALALSVGARPVTMDAGTHDRLLALVSHLPHVTAAALLLAAGAGPAAGAGAASGISALGEAGSVEAGMGMSALRLAGPGFRDSTRLAASNLELLTDILLTNRTEVLEAIGELQSALADLKTALLANDEPALRALLTRARALRGSL